MRRILLLFVLFACSNKEKTEPPPSPIVDEKAKRIVYEGVIKTEFGEAPIELKLDEAETGLTSAFELQGEVAPDMVFAVVVGEYSTLYGAAGNEVILQLHGNYAAGPLPKYDPKNPTSTFKPEIRDLDLFFISEGGNKLILVDEDFDRIADDNRYTLYKRSRLFTAEGYITFEESRTAFHEQHTREDWIVAPLAMYSIAKQTYDSLATEEFEGIYLKALAYSVESDSSDKELLVIKRIIEIKKSDAYTDKKQSSLY